MITANSRRELAKTVGARMKEEIPAKDVWEAQ